MRSSSDEDFVPFLSFGECQYSLKKKIKFELFISVLQWLFQPGGSRVCPQQSLKPHWSVYSFVFIMMFNKNVNNIIFISKRITD